MIVDEQGRELVWDSEPAGTSQYDLAALVGAPTSTTQETIPPKQFDQLFSPVRNLGKTCQIKYRLLHL